MAAFDPELISAYLDDELSRDERAQVEAWLAESEEARQVLERLRAVSGAVHALPRRQLGDDFADEVLHAIGRRRPTASGSDVDNTSGPAKPLSVVEGQTAEDAEQASPPQTTAPTPRSGHAGRRTVRHGYWLTPVAGIAAAVLVALWIGRQDTQRERIARLPETTTALSEFERASEADGDGLRDARGRVRALAESLGMSKAAPDSVSEATPEPSIVSKGGFNEDRSVLGGIGGGGLGGGAGEEAQQGQRTEGGGVDRLAVPLEQSVDELNPALAIQSISETGAAVVWVSSPDQRAGMSALQRALHSNAIVTEQPPENTASDKSADVVEELRLLNRHVEADEADALYVEANVDQLSGTLQLLKQQQKPGEIAKITLQAVTPEVLQQELGAQVQLGDAAADAPEAEVPRQVRSRAAAKPSEEQKARLNDAVSRRAQSRQQQAANNELRDGEEALHYGRQVQLKWRGNKQQKPISSGEERFAAPALGQLRFKNAPPSPTSPMNRRADRKAAGADAEESRSGQSKQDERSRSGAPSGPARRQKLFGKDGSALAAAVSGPARPLKVLFVFETPPAADTAKSEPAP